MAATTARSFILSRLLSNDLSFKRTSFLRRSSPPSSIPAVSCLSSSGGVSDEFVSTRKSSFDRGFSVIANMLKRIEPLDNSVISKGVSEYAKDSMKQTISTMLGLLPSNHFDVTITVSKLPLHRLLISAIITGYTLWNAEYRMSLMRNFEIPVEERKGEVGSSKDEGERREEREESGNGGSEVSGEDIEISPQLLGDLSPEALKYIQHLESELSNAKEELNAWKHETLKIECDRENRNDLLEYLRSLDADMVMELSRPSSIEVEDIIHQLVSNVLRRFFKDDPISNFARDSVVVNPDNHQDDADAFRNAVGTSRDYLAKLLFWCMLMGHHLRGLENRLHLSCVVGLL